MKYNPVKIMKLKNQTNKLVTMQLIKYNSGNFIKKQKYKSHINKKNGSEI